MASIFGILAEIFADIYSMRCFLFGVQGASLLFKLILLSFVSSKMLQTKSPPASWRYIVIVLFCSALEDFAWVASLARFTFMPSLDYRPVLFLVRITWASNSILYQAFALFIEAFAERPIKFVRYHFVAFAIAAFFFLFATVLAISQYNLPFDRPPIEFTVYTMESVYALCFLMPATLFFTWRKLQNQTSHKILKRQFDTIIKFLIFPHLCFNIFNTFPIPLSHTNAISILAMALSNLFLTITLFYCLKQIIRFRFLNMNTHVRSSQAFNFTDNFKTVLESLGTANTSSEVKLLTQRFLSQLFHIQTASTGLHLRASEPFLQTDHTRIEMYAEPTDSRVEYFLGEQRTKKTTAVLEYLKEVKVLIYDEVEYDNFHEKDQKKETILLFLDEIQADIFLPIYADNNIIGYITVDRHARGNKLYSDIERDEIIVFASFLSKIINLLQNRNLNELLKQRKDIIEELYLKHQEINQYKESIRSFLQDSHRGIGIIFYKNRKFICANQEARDLIEIDPNQHEGNSITKALRHSAQQAFIYKTNQTQLAKTPSGKRVVLSCIPQIEHNNVIITVYYPEVYDTIKEQLDAMRDPSDWDYLLYLETTQTGKLINELIPGAGKLLLNFKIDLLKLSLGKKALLLDLPEDDLIPLVDLIHHISLRETLYILELGSQVSNADTIIKLFGINPLYGSSTSIPLLEKLNKKGTLLIKNIHLLDLEAQKNLAQFIRYGFYTIFKSDKRVQSDVRIICSTNHDLGTLVQEGKFSRALFNELKKESLTMPHLLTLSDDEMNELVEGFTDQALTTKEFKSLISLSHKDKDYIATQRPVSLNEMKGRVQQLLINKSKKTGIYHEKQFNSGYNVTDPKLIEAARLGKYALKDPKLLQLLWGKFKSQNKIALFLGVNRSSVSRRCKEYNIV